MTATATETPLLISSDGSVQRVEESPEEMQEGTFLVRSQEDLEEVPTAVLLKVYNAHSEKAIKKFGDRETAVSRTWEALGNSSTPDQEDSTEASAAPESTGRRGRASTYIGQRIIPTALGLSAQRQGDSRRSRSFAVIRENPGISFEDYLAKGGDPQDLNILVNRRKHATILAEGQDVPEEFPEVEDPKGIAARAAARKAQQEKAAAAKEKGKKQAQTPGKAGRAPRVKPEQAEQPIKE